MYYGAFGIFTNSRTMEFHCPGARFVGVGLVEDWRFEWRGCADTERCEGSVLELVVWDITPDHLRALDRVEGYPHFYTRERVHVVLADGREVNAQMYTMTHKGERSFNNHMGGSVRSGWMENGLDMDRFIDAVQRANDEERRADAKRYLTDYARRRL